MFNKDPERQSRSKGNGTFRAGKREVEPGLLSIDSSSSVLLSSLELSDIKVYEYRFR